MISNQNCHGKKLKIAVFILRMISQEEMGDIWESPPHP
jgi:hypothetical protein